jgi:hypothetical protein
VDFSIFHTVVFKAVATFLQTFWNDGTGRIFLVTFLAYSISYMVYSGYISWFAGGYGGLLLSQAGFTAIDFLALIPTVFVLIFESIGPFIKSIGKFIFWNILIPLFLFILIIVIRLYFQNLLPNTIMGFVGVPFLLLATILRVINSEKENKLFSKLSTLGLWASTIFLALSVSIGSSTNRTLTPGVQSSPNLFLIAYSIDSIFWEIVAPILLIFILILPLWLGIYLASFVTKEKLLSRIMRIDLKQPIAIATAKLSVNKDIHSYIFSEDFPVYLISTFTKTTAIYLPQETTRTERSRMLLVSNDLIHSLELEGRKKGK